MKRQPRIVKHQRTKVLENQKDYSGEQSPYWRWVEQNQPHDDDGIPQEPVQANPDSLPESAQPFPRDSGYSVGDISRQLSGQQKKVFELYVQEGKSEKEIGIILKIGEKTVRTYLQRVRDKFKYYV